LPDIFPDIFLLKTCRWIITLKYFIWWLSLFYLPAFDLLIYDFFMYVTIAAVWCSFLSILTQVCVVFIETPDYDKIQHSHDIWHAAKNLGKKITKVFYFIIFFYV
jgi:hypothetical protein